MTSTVSLSALRDCLAPLSGRVDDYYGIVRAAGFTTCLVNEDWIEAHCDPKDVAVHKRYLVELAQEALLRDKIEEVLYTDLLDCKSSWLNDLKAKRLAETGPLDQLKDGPQTRHLKQLSPCLRALIRLSASTRSTDKEQVDTQTAEFTRRREAELAYHHEEIVRLDSHLARDFDEPALQGFLAQRLYEKLQNRKAALRSMARPDGRVDIVTVGTSQHVVFVVVPNMTIRAREASPKIPTGRLSVGFRLVEREALEAPVYQRDRQIVVRLSNLLPNEFNDYGLFEGREEFSLNVLAWEKAVEVIVPDALNILEGVLSDQRY